MKLPVMPPVSPMLAKAVPEVPEGGFLYEPKWDGFRSIIFRDGDEVEVGSRNEKPMTRYFPEVVESVKAALPDKCVVDGEIVVPLGGRLEFEVLQQRIHPADSRVRKLALETPAHFVAFDLLAVGDESLMGTPFGERRARLEAAVTRTADVHVTAATRDLAEAKRWFTDFEGAGLDGVVAKGLDLTYQPDKRVMFKIKHARTADCVLAGFRWHKSGPIVGSLVLGLYDGDQLRHVGVAASFPMKRRAELVDELAPLREGADIDHPWAGNEFGPGGVPNRWNAGKDMSFELLRPELVVEVAYDQMEGHRFRHTAQFRHWRPDRDPKSCTFAQLERPLKCAIEEVFEA
ncbi:ATP-dependent DNA ligase [Amycolatopsis sp.]|uniref:ATP-dependent DNA ligase n=1 Tax=Amycolatopsis sp. TaxID=37632 RepID=UPI002BBA1D5E|nr:ATP-dependent DNA ligase [Amycolatopsis sp.]HVV13701.1 ATP-dependent DNA ligase [Amycolatopsis sp.]